MNIALVVPGGVDRSGRERSIPALLWLIERLARRHRVTVVALHQYAEPCSYGLLGATVHNLGQRRGGVPGLALWRAARAVASLAPEAEVAHGFWGDTAGLVAALAARRLRVPSVVSLGGGELVALPELGYGSQLRWRARAQVALALRLASRLTVASAPMAAQVAARGFRAEQVPLGVDEAHFAAYQAGAGPPWRLLHVASLNAVKDQATLLRAMRRIVDAEPGASLDIVGVDTRGGAVQQGCAALGLEGHVRFHGWLPNDALRPFYERAHLFLLTSRHEAGPVAVLEAAASSVPTVGTAVGHVAEGAGAWSCAVPVGDAGALAEAAVALLRDGARRAALGAAARAWAARHDADWTAGRFEAIYNSLIHE